MSTCTPYSAGSEEAARRRQEELEVEVEDLKGELMGVRAVLAAQEDQSARGDAEKALKKALEETQAELRVAEAALDKAKEREAEEEGKRKGEG